MYTIDVWCVAIAITCEAQFDFVGFVRQTIVVYSLIFKKKKIFMSLIMISPLCLYNLILCPKLFFVYMLQYSSL